MNHNLNNGDVVIILADEGNIYTEVVYITDDGDDGTVKIATPTEVGFLTKLSCISMGNGHVVKREDCTYVGRQ